MQENLSFFINQTPFTEHPNAPLARLVAGELVKALNFIALFRVMRRRRCIRYRFFRKNWALKIFI